MCWSGDKIPTTANNDQVLLVCMAKWVLPTATVYNLFYRNH